MDRLREMEIFIQTVESGSLSAAARTLGLSVAVVSKELARLEQRLGVLLLTRTTRHLALTAEGEMFHASAVRLIADVAEAEATVGSAKGGMSGPLRITAPVAFGRRFVAPLLAQLANQHPDLQPHLHLTDAVVNLAEENIDLAIRFGVVADPGLVIRKIADNDRIVCASPAYLERMGHPRVPEDLARHAMLVIGTDGAKSYRFADHDDHQQSVRISARLSSTNGDVVHDWALAGLGLEVKSWWDVAEDLAQGRVVRALPDWAIPDSGMHAVFLARRHLPHRVRTMIESLRACLSEAQRRFDAPH